MDQSKSCYDSILLPVILYQSLRFHHVFLMVSITSLIWVPFITYKYMLVRDFEGIWYNDQKGISKVFINDFSKRFISKNPMINYDPFDTFSPRISEEEKELIKEATKKEICATPSQIISMKVFGADGLQASFYKNIGKYVSKIVKAFFFNGHMLKKTIRFLSH